jgi:hypothetical protein
MRKARIYKLLQQAFAKEQLHYRVTILLMQSYFVIKLHLCNYKTKFHVFQSKYLKVNYSNRAFNFSYTQLIFLYDDEDEIFRLYFFSILFL